jgi:hypothetical protein
MKVTITISQDVNLKYVRCVLPVRYEEKDIPNNYPFRKNDVWNITINVDTGQIIDWPAGVAPLALHMKVCKGGSYYLVGEVVLWKREQDHVPEFIQQEYGDYIDFKIDANGLITNWKDFGCREVIEAYLN